MSEVKQKKIVKTIKVDLDKCHGCRACEVACAAFHSSPKYSIVNPARSRIRVYRDELNDVFCPYGLALMPRQNVTGTRVT